MAQRKISLNCDMGESFGAWQMGNDAKAIAVVDMVNVACGYHAGDPMVMSQTVALALQHDVEIGAHASYPDLQGFGRRHISLSAEEITQMIIYQVGALKAICESQNSQLRYVKPHGALYHDMMQDLAIFESVVDAVSCFNLPLMVLARADNQTLLDIADHYELPLLFEAYADRSYLANGELAPKTMHNAVLSDGDDILNQVYQLVHYGRVKTLDGGYLNLEADTLCVHGDNPHAIELIHKIRRILEA